MQADRFAAWTARRADADGELKCVFENGDVVEGVCPHTGWVAPWLWEKIDNDERWRLYKLTQEMLKKKQPPPSPLSTPGGIEPGYGKWVAVHNEECELWKRGDAAAKAYNNTELATKQDLTLSDVALQSDTLIKEKTGMVEAKGEKMQQKIDELEEQVKLMETRGDHQTVKHCELEIVISKMREEINELQEQHNVLATRSLQLTTKNDELEDTISKMQKKVDELQEQQALHETMHTATNGLVQVLDGKVKRVQLAVSDMDAAQDRPAIAARR